MYIAFLIPSCRSGSAFQGSYSKFGEAGTDDFWLDNVKCTGSESSIAKCSHNGWGNENCDRQEAAKVICSGRT